MQRVGDYPDTNSGLSCWYLDQCYPAKRLAERPPPGDASRPRVFQQASRVPDSSRRAGSTPDSLRLHRLAPPISPPSDVTNELSAMFCALNGRRSILRDEIFDKSAATIRVLPTDDAVPGTINVRAGAFMAAGAVEKTGDASPAMALAPGAPVYVLRTLSDSTPNEYARRRRARCPNDSPLLTACPIADAPRTRVSRSGVGMSVE